MLMKVLPVALPTSALGIVKLIASVLLAPTNGWVAWAPDALLTVVP